MAKEEEPDAPHTQDDGAPSRPPEGLPDPAWSAAAPGAGPGSAGLGAANYSGGPVAVNNNGKGDYPLYVANDHTVYAMRFSAMPALLNAAGDPLTTAGHVLRQGAHQPDGDAVGRLEPRLHLEPDHAAVGAGARRLA